MAQADNAHVACDPSRIQYPIQCLKFHWFTGKFQQKKLRFLKVLLSSFIADGESPVMQFLFFFILTLSTVFFSRSLSATLVQIPGSDNLTSNPRVLTDGSINSTLGLSALPDELGLTYEIGGPKLRITSALMNTVATLRTLALDDWEGKVIDGSEYKLDDYPEVSIQVNTPRRKRNIRVGFVIWAICYGMYEMIETKKFELAQFQISWEGQLVGWVHVVPIPSSKIEEGRNHGTLSLGNRSIALPSAKQPLNITNAVTMDNAEDADDARLSVDFQPFGDKLGIYDVIVPVMSGLTDMGKIPSHYESSGLVIGLHGFDGHVCFLPQIPFRTSPPTLTYGWLIRTLARIPAYMLGAARFGEVTMRVMVDDVIVGNGRVSTAPQCDDDKSISDS